MCAHTYAHRGSPRTPSSPSEGRPPARPQSRLASGYPPLSSVLQQDASPGAQVLTLLPPPGLVSRGVRHVDLGSDTWVEPQLSSDLGPSVKRTLRAPHGIAARMRITRLVPTWPRTRARKWEQ